MHWYITNIRREAPNATLNVFRDYPTFYHSNTCSSMNKEKTQLGSTQLWHTVLYSCRGWLEPNFITRPILQRYFSHFKTRRDFAVIAWTDMPAIAATSNETQRKIKQAKWKKKRLRYFKWGLTVVASGTAVVRDAFTAIVFTAHSTPLRYTLASLESNELSEKRCHVNEANSRLESRNGHIRRRYVDMRTRFTKQ